MPATPQVDATLFKGQAAYSLDEGLTIKGLCGIADLVLPSQDAGEINNTDNCSVDSVTGKAIQTKQPDRENNTACTFRLNFDPTNNDQVAFLAACETNAVPILLNFQNYDGAGSDATEFYAYRQTNVRSNPSMGDVISYAMVMNTYGEVDYHATLAVITP